MSPKTLNDAQNLYFESCATHFSDQLWVIMPLRSSNRRSQQRVTSWKYGRIWSLWRPQRHELNEFQETVNESHAALDMKSKQCNDGDGPKRLRRSQCTVQCLSSMVQYDAQTLVYNPRPLFVFFLSNLYREGVVKNRLVKNN